MSFLSGRWGGGAGDRAGGLTRAVLLGVFHKQEIKE